MYKKNHKLYTKIVVFYTVTPCSNYVFNRKPNKNYSLVRAKTEYHHQNQFLVPVDLL